MSEKNRIETLDALRGVASLAVAWFHFTNGDKLLDNFPVLKATGKYGWLGLSVFFVLSGFVIPYSLHLARFQLRCIGRFMLKRIIRLDPPYVASIFMILILNYVAMMVPGFKGIPFKFALPQFLAHFGYVNALVGYVWYNPVYWTLAIEFQWYLFISLTFGLLVFRQGSLRWVLMALFAFLPFIFPSESLLFKYMPLFGLGVVSFQYYTKMIFRFEFITLVTLFALLSVVVVKLPVGIAGAATVVVILFSSLRQPWLLKLGAISYSLYLVHVPVGGRWINLCLRLPDVLWVKLLALGGAVTISMLVAWLLWKFVERPAMLFASRIQTTKLKTR